MKKLLALLFFCLAALTPAAFAEEGGALLTLKVNNIQVHAKWEDSHDNFSIDNGKLLYDGGLTLPHTATITISVEDNFKALNESYVNLTAMATMSIELLPNPNQKTIFIMGGYDRNTVLQDVWSSTDGKNWTEEPTPGWSGRQGLQVVKHNSTIYVLGGRDVSNNYLNDVWSSTDGKNWVSVAIAGWTPRSGHQAVVHNGTIYVVGGYDGADKKDVWSSVDGITWAEVTSSAEWPVRQSHQVVSYQEKMYMMGGAVGITPLNDVWSSADGKTWLQETGGAEWSARYWYKAVVHNNKIYVLGGTSNRPADDVWFSTDGKTWEQVGGWGWDSSIRRSHQAVSQDDLLYVLSGYKGTSPDNDVWSSSDSQNWVEVTPDAGWVGRIAFGAVVLP